MIENNKYKTMELLFKLSAPHQNDQNIAANTEDSSLSNLLTNLSDISGNELKPYKINGMGNDIEESDNSLFTKDLSGCICASKKTTPVRKRKKTIAKPCHPPHCKDEDIVFTMNLRKRRRTVYYKKNESKSSNDESDSNSCDESTDLFNIMKPHSPTTSLDSAIDISHDFQLNDCPMSDCVFDFPTNDNLTFSDSRLDSKAINNLCNKSNEMIDPVSPAWRSTISYHSETGDTQEMFYDKTFPQIGCSSINKSTQTVQTTTLPLKNSFYCNARNKVHTPSKKGLLFMNALKSTSKGLLELMDFRKEINLASNLDLAERFLLTDTDGAFQ